MNKITITASTNPTSTITELTNDFLKDFAPLETLNGGKALLLYDEKSNTYYIPCHLKTIDFVDKADFNATIDGSEDDDLYKLNRDITENEGAFATMISDAKAGRSFEDIVVEFDKSYTAELPLKIYGGQHRVKAIQSAITIKPNNYHGFRIYFGLTKEQKVEIATINNTSITVSNDLLDRMKEQLLGSELRDFCQSIGLLSTSQDFSDKKDSLIPTVRVARTLVVNYWKGRNAISTDFHTPLVCKSGGIDEEYLSIRETVGWNDEDFIEAGKKFNFLHKTQREKVSKRKNDSYSQFSSKAISLAVIASWSYAAGLYSHNKNNQNILYGITDNLGVNEDPLNAKALSEARLKGIDPDTYRGLGARISPDELGRMLEVFVVLVEKATEKKISKNLANAAIQSYEAKKATNNAAKSLSKI
ncbi:MAG: hypothetical protein JZU47_16815 [Prolixibacteraceae bacterium]|nr:hypothetical protein [Prolixibacteraceae bacterium]